MYKRHCFAALFLFLASFIAVLFFSYEMPESTTGHFVTFFSIVFGFYLTTLSIFYGSSFTRRLYNEEDPLIKTQTKLHTLNKYFKFSSATSMAAILLLLVGSLFGVGSYDHLKGGSSGERQHVHLFEVCWETIFTGVSVGMIFVNIFFMIILFRILFNAFVEEGMERDI